MIGASGVGKTSLVRQFVQSIFSEKYHTTIGVKIDKKQISVDDQEVTLMLWDLQGEDADFKIRPSFLRGASGYLLVIDLTRHETLVTAFSIQKMIKHEVGEVPHLMLFNKNDLTEDVEITDDEIETVAAESHGYFRTSAKTGEMVETAFHQLARQMIGK
jgi:small GTP-binding protein